MTKSAKRLVNSAFLANLQPFERNPMLMQKNYFIMRMVTLVPPAAFLSISSP